MRIAIWLGLFIWGISAVTIPTAIYAKLLMALGAVTWLIICIVVSVSIYWWLWMKLVENDLD